MLASERAREELRAARTAFTAVLKQAPEAAPQVADALEALDRLERLMERGTEQGRPAAKRGLRNRPKTYRVEGPPGREALCEYREKDPDHPFRCPKATYDAMARVMASTPKLAKFGDIEKGLKKDLGDLPAVYQLRVVLRFWTTPDVDLVERVRARYRARRPAEFRRLATQAWRRMSVAKHGAEM